MLVDSLAVIDVSVIVLGIVVPSVGAEVAVLSVVNSPVVAGRVAVVALLVASVVRIVSVTLPDASVVPVVSVVIVEMLVSLVVIRLLGTIVTLVDSAADVEIVPLVGVSVLVLTSEVV